MKKITLTLMLLFALILTSCGTEITVEPSGYENVDVLNQCIIGYVEPTREDFCTETDLAQEIENYALYFSDRFEYEDESINVTLSNTAVHSITKNRMFNIHIWFSITDEFSDDIHNVLELIFLQVVQEIQEDVDFLTSVTINFDFEDSGSFFFGRIINGNKTENETYNKISFTDESKSTSENFNDTFDTYFINDEENIYTRILLIIHSSDSTKALDIDHKDKEFSYISENPEYSTENFELLIELLLPGYDLVEFSF